MPFKNDIISKSTDCSSEDIVVKHAATSLEHRAPSWHRPH